MNLSEQVLEALDRATAALPGGGERREGQRTMAEAVARTIADEGHLCVQAGTGTGKSLAYLVPILVSGRKAVVATATKALQDQLAGKDLPALARHLDHDFEYAVLKGRSNYLCRQRLDEVDSGDRLEIEVEGEELDPATVAQLRHFEETCETGDRAELEAELGDQAWRQVSVGRDECPGASRCPRGEDCFAERARERAWAADVMILNLHLYVLHALLPGGMEGHDLVVIDEAHQLEDIVAQAAGVSLSATRCSALARSLSALVTGTDVNRDLEDAAERLRDSLRPHVGSRLVAGPDDDLRPALDAVHALADKVISSLRAVPDDAPLDLTTKAQRVRQAATSLLEDLERLRFPDDTDVIWVDGPASNPALRATPVDVAGLLREHVWADRTAVLTSATLPTDLADRLGLPVSSEILDVGSPFDYESQALLYCPTHLPDPRSPEASEARMAELEELIVAAGGRTLALFTSIAAMREAAAELDNRLPWPVLVQGDRAKAALLAAFAADEETSLFATISFWQGVDVPGASCRLVTIDRLPFPRPDDPVLEARRERAGSAAFRTVDLPRAAMMLAQGAGRLIRSHTDEGVVAVLDPRLATARSYRWTLVNALPPMRRTRDRDEAVGFLRRLRDSGSA